MLAYGKTVFTVTASKKDMKSKAVKVSLTVRPKKLTIKKAVSSKKRQIKITWKKDSMADGYELQYSPEPNFRAKTSRTASSKTNKSVKCTLKKLVRGQTYYIRMRAFKLVSGKKVAGVWTKTRKVTTK